MTDTDTAPMGPNVGRFVRSAWLLLFAQLIAALFAIGATGWAAFYVADLRAERDFLRAQVEEFTGGAIIDPVNEAPAVDDVEFVDDPVMNEEPVTVEEEPPSATPPPQTSRPPPNRAPDTTPPHPATARPVPTRPAPTRPERPRTERPTPTAPAPPQRNRAYPGGLPGDGVNNAEPPFVPGRFTPEAPVGRTPVIPDIDLNDVVREPEGRDSNQTITDDQGPNY
jgi:hypothetical protein